MTEDAFLRYRMAVVERMPDSPSLQKPLRRWLDRERGFGACSVVSKLSDGELRR